MICYLCNSVPLLCCLERNTIMDCKFCCAKDNHSTKQESSRQDRRVARTKNSINSAFLSLLRRKDISKITVKELCEEADINRKTFYTYHDSIADVLSEIENNMVDKFYNSMNELKKQNENRTVADVFVCTEELLQKDSELIHKLVQIDALSGLEIKINKRLKQYAADVISEEYGSGDEVIELSLDYIVSGAIAMNIEWFCREKPMPFETLCEMNKEFIEKNIEIALKYSRK